MPEIDGVEPASVRRNGRNSSRTECDICRHGNQCQSQELDFRFHLSSPARAASAHFSSLGSMTGARHHVLLARSFPQPKANGGSVVVVRLGYSKRDIATVRGPLLFHHCYLIKSGRMLLMRTSRRTAWPIEETLLVPSCCCCIWVSWLHTYTNLTCSRRPASPMTSGRQNS